MKSSASIPLLIGILIAPAGLAAAADADATPPIKVVLHPAAEAHPALKYQLLPPLIDRRPGNAAVHYLKVPHEETPLFSDQAFWDSIDKWTEMPLPELRKEVRANRYPFLTGEWSIVEMLDRGARCDTCDWDIPIREHEYISILLPDIQASRLSGRILAARARIQIAKGQYADAIHTLQTGFALARHVGQAPTLINGLVGVAIAGMMAKQVETLVQQPDAPNLYWALASLPRPLIDFRLGYEGELASIYLSYPELRDLEHKNYPAEQWKQLLQRTIAGFAKVFGSGPGSQFSLMLVPKMLEGYPRAKRLLISQGRSATEVEAMPVAQVVLLYTMQTYDELRDEVFKWFSLPYPEARAGMAQADKRLKESVGSGREIIPIAAMLLPAVRTCKEAETRMSRQIAALQVLEALRMYAAGHDGKLPETLQEITEVPVPLDPFRGEPFIYIRTGDTARLESPYPSNNKNPLTYEIQLKAK
jgi:hypothetical protein